MKLFRSALAACALLISAHASATVTTYTITGTLGTPWAAPNPSLASYYPSGTPVSGVFSIDDSFVTSYTYENNYYGGFSGTFKFGGNVVNVATSDVYVHSQAGPTYLTMLGGNAWGTGGTITESQPAGELQLTGLQLMLLYSSQPAKDTPISALLAAPDLPSATLYLNYVDAHGNEVGDTWQITSVSAVPEPDAAILLLSGGAVLLAASSRRRRSV